MYKLLNLKSRKSKFENEYQKLMELADQLHETDAREATGKRQEANQVLLRLMMMDYPHLGV